MGLGVFSVALRRNRDVGLRQATCIGVGGLAEKRGAQLLHHRLGDVVLHSEDVVERPVIRLRPELNAVRRLHQLDRDPHAVPRLAHAPVQERRHVQPLADHGEILVLPLELERGGTRGHPEPADLGQHVEEFVCKTVGEVLVLLASAPIHEREHGNGGDISRGRRP